MNRSGIRYRLACAFATLLLAPLAIAQSPTVQDPTFFAQSVYPVFEAAGCRGCHYGDGVASTTRLRFPAPGAPREQVTAFGLKLAMLVDRADPALSLVLQKPTNRVQHTGGERIAPGSEQEAALRSWVDYLAGTSPEQVESATRKLETYRPAAEAGPQKRRLREDQVRNSVG